LRHRRAVEHLQLGVDGRDLGIDLRLERVSGRDLLLRGQLRPLGRDLLLLQGADPHAGLVVELLDGRRLAEELFRIAAGEHLQRRVGPAVHVAHGGELGDRLLAARHRRLRLRGRPLSHLHLGIGVRELDLQTVILLAERVDLVRQLRGLRDELLE
jgi:hypothetical protein